jgi:hypothetical protein
MFLSFTLLAACSKEEDEAAAAPRAKRVERPSRSSRDSEKVKEFYTVGDGVTAPVPVYQTDAHYTYEGEDSVGTINVRAIVKADGSVGKVELLGPDNRYTRAELDAVRQWVFDPGKKDGKPVPVQVMLSIDGVPLAPDEGF